MSSASSVLPSAASLAFRANLAKLVSPLRRVRPRAPFWELAAHRAPTLALYRNLLRNAPDDDIRWRVSSLFRQHHHATGTEKTRRELLKGYKWLDAFKLARTGDEKQQAILARYSRLLAVRAGKGYWKGLVRQELAWQERLKSRPILTGALMKATYYNPPLPRMKPQPTVISDIIRARYKAREGRWARRGLMVEDLRDLAEEAKFEDGLVNLGEDFEPVFRNVNEWRGPIFKAIAQVDSWNTNDVKRQYRPVSPELRQILLDARREKIANKTRERARERRGVILKRTLARKRQGPPPHFLSRMTPAQRHRDKIVRAVGEVGYVGMMKQRMGFKLRDGGRGLAREDSFDLEGEQLERLQEMEKEYYAESKRRRREHQAQQQDN
ncbi:hypothetical protein HMN09_00492400 [Mycena chlorophos]|uniref:Uncharacterized protein n=1 Tax=Mycena chlorophos TaxID=658473 RepID=A0A8H6WD17_MYCCL|nr:hypothetical protein HMN09_00492400 [Mycena chlorophos]